MRDLLSGTICVFILFLLLWHPQTANLYQNCPSITVLLCQIRSGYPCINSKILCVPLFSNFIQTFKLDETAEEPGDFLFKKKKKQQESFPNFSWGCVSGRWCSAPSSCRGWVWSRRGLSHRSSGQSWTLNRDMLSHLLAMRGMSYLSSEVCVWGKHKTFFNFYYRSIFISYGDTCFCRGINTNSFFLLFYREKPGSRTATHR